MTPIRVLLARISQPWLNYLNLLESGKVRVAAVYQRCDSLLVDPATRALVVGEPGWETRLVGDDDDAIEIEEPFRTVMVNDAAELAQMLDALEVGRLHSQAGGSHRVDTALRFFARVADTCWRHSPGFDDDSDLDEDIVVDAVTALETIFLERWQKKKGASLSSRASWLLEPSPLRRAQLEEQIQELYDLRSAIVHGDDPATATNLTRMAQFAEYVVRRAVEAFIRLGGDQRRLIQGATDSSMAKDNWRLARILIKP